MGAGSSKSRSRSRGREEGAVVGLAAAAVGVMTAALSASPGVITQEEERAPVKKRRASSGDAKGRRRVSGLAALTRTLSHEDVLEVTEDDDTDVNAADGFEDASSSSDEDEALRQLQLAAQLRQQEEDRVKREQLLLRAKHLEQEEERRRVEYERQVADLQAERETEEGLRNMMIIQQQQQHLLLQQQQQQAEVWQRQQYEAQLALERQRERIFRRRGRRRKA